MDQYGAMLSTQTENGQQTQEKSQDFHNYDMTLFSSTNYIQSLPIEGFDSAFKLQFKSFLPQWC